MALILIVATTANHLLPMFQNPPPLGTTCVDGYGHLLNYEVGQQLTPDFAACVQRHAEIFLARDVPESKDLAKSFLTLLTAVLVASITFSEKIVGVSQASWFPRALIIFCWVCILGAIVACGVGLTSITIAGGFAAYNPFLAYWTLEITAVRYFVAAGLMFCLGLASLLVAGVLSLWKPLRIGGLPEAVPDARQST